MTDIIRKHIGLVNIVIEAPKNRKEQENSSSICPERATTDIIREINADPITTIASIQRM